jgi:hypothetical protein
MRHTLAAMTLAGAACLPAASAMAYPIDCAIFLCLAGGWPASTECSAARAEFIRRITPFPIEPPLQIWRCPMQASFRDKDRATEKLFDIAFRDRHQRYPSSAWLLNHPLTQADAGSVPFAPFDGGAGRDGAALEMVQAIPNPDRKADIDISDPDFDFVRSIKVWHVRGFQQSKKDEGCRRYQSTDVGSYGEQGEFHWSDAPAGAVPESFVFRNGYGTDCPLAGVRAVFVEWRDYQGNYGFEQVDY